MFKITLVGDPKSGRTALVRRLIDRTFLTDEYALVTHWRHHTHSHTDTGNKQI